MSDQLGMFAQEDDDLPRGFKYQRELFSAREEEELISNIRELPFREFEFHGFTGKRRVVSFGWKYDFSERELIKANDIPPFLFPAREKAAVFAEIKPFDLQHVLVTEYSEGAAIGWHKDKAVFGDVIGISLLSACTFRFRRQHGKKWERRSIIAEPRSVYLLRGESRTDWEHSIPGVASLRYSITFRNLREDLR
ncbi:MAG TPA: alpha-ketoglutarate-dependent dioxygenase AlkB [Gemmatimonadaceae bacterium]